MAPVCAEHATETAAELARQARGATVPLDKEHALHKVFRIRNAEPELDRITLLRREHCSHRQFLNGKLLREHPPRFLGYIGHCIKGVHALLVQPFRHLFGAECGLAERGHCFSKGGQGKVFEVCFSIGGHLHSAIFF